MDLINLVLPVHFSKRSWFFVDLGMILVPETSAKWGFRWSFLRSCCWYTESVILNNPPLKLDLGDLQSSSETYCWPILHRLGRQIGAQMMSKFYYTKNINKYIPVLKKQMTRREFISLKLFTLKNAWNFNSFWTC